MSDTNVEWGTRPPVRRLGGDVPVDPRKRWPKSGVFRFWGQVGQTVDNSPPPLKNPWRRPWSAIVLSSGLRKSVIQDNISKAGKDKFCLA